MSGNRLIGLAQKDLKASSLKVSSILVGLYLKDMPRNRPIPTKMHNCILHKTRPTFFVFFCILSMTDKNTQYM